MSKKRPDTLLSKDESIEKVWSQHGDKYYLGDIALEHTRLSNTIYRLCIDDFSRFYLLAIEEKFQFNYKIYGLETAFIDRVEKTYINTKGNLGIILNGVKGTGKTVSSKMICNRLNQPVILIDQAIPGCHIYLNDIPQDITIFIDEYEKIFKENSSDMLTIMDGALNSIYRRVFILTTNDLYVNQNLLQRPGRIKYLKTYADLLPPIIEEIVNDILIYTNLVEEVKLFISTLEIITVDIVKAICEEVNIHNESPKEFSNIFNVKKITGKYDVYEVGDKIDTVVKKNAKISPRPDYYPELADSRYSFYVADEYKGVIVEVLDENTVIVENYEEKQKETSGTISDLIMPMVAKSIARSLDFSFDEDSNVKSKSKSKKKNQPEAAPEQILTRKTYVIRDSRMANRVYGWENRHDY